MKSSNSLQSFPTTKLVFAAAAAAAIAYAALPRPSRIRRGQVAIITGSSSGLGLALAHRFGHAGLKIMLAARSESDLADARGQLLSSGSIEDPENVRTFPCDLTRPESAAALIQATLQAFGAIDILINNAGIIEVGPALNQPLQSYRQAMDVNFYAALYTTYAALPHLLGRQSGAIVNISSIGGKVAVPHLLPYVASKFALTGFSEGLHAELRSQGVRVTTVCPGLMRTGGESHARFHGQVAKESAWFKTSARTPLISVDAKYAANKIFNAADQGRAEITIAPQAWLAARFAGLAPETTQAIASLISAYLLPAPAAMEPQANRV